MTAIVSVKTLLKSCCATLKFSFSDVGTFYACDISCCGQFSILHIVLKVMVTNDSYCWQDFGFGQQAETRNAPVV